MKTTLKFVIPGLIAGAMGYLIALLYAPLRIGTVETCQGTRNNAPATFNCVRQGTTVFVEVDSVVYALQILPPSTKTYSSYYSAQLTYFFRPGSIRRFANNWYQSAAAFGLPYDEKFEWHPDTVVEGNAVKFRTLGKSLVKVVAF